MTAGIRSKDRSVNWVGKAPPYVVQWMADRREAYFRATDNPCLYPSGLVAILGEATKEDYLRC